MSNSKFIFIVSLVFWSALPLTAQDTGYTFTPLFSFDRSDIVSMYSDEAAERFYLHSTDSLFVLSADGTIQSAEPSELMYGCSYKGKIYRHVSQGDAIIDEKGDTVIQFVYDSNLGGPSFLAAISSLFACNDKGFYMAHSRGSRSDQFVLANKEGVHFACYVDCPMLLNGVAISNDTIYAIGEVVDASTESAKDDSWLLKYPLQEAHLEGFPELLDRSNRSVVGLTIVGDSFITWSNADKCMYRITKSTTGITDVIQEPQATSPYYDLLGRPVSHLTTGIYIRNGRKVVLK